MNSLILHSTFGAFTVLLDDKRAPVTCRYFCDLARRGELDDCSVFRILNADNQPPGETCPIQVVQVAPTLDLASPRHPIIHEDTRQTGLTHRRWTVSAARFDLGELYGSFFICMRDEPQLDWGGARQPDGQGFAAFGRVVDGRRNVERIFLQAEADEILANKIPLHKITLVETT